MDERLAVLCLSNGRKQIKAILEISLPNLDRRLKTLGLRGLPYSKAISPKNAEWIAVATRNARESKVRPSDLMAGVMLKPVVHARWRAWKEMKETYPHYSIAGIARTSGHDWTTVLHGLKRLSGASPRSLRHASYRAAARVG